MKNTNIILLAAVAIVLTSACAKKRPVEKIVDLEGNRLAKADFDNKREWLGKVTIVNNGSNSAFGFVGLESEVQIGSFTFTKDHLQYVTRDAINKEARVLNQWAITHSDYHQKVSGGRVSNVETENDEIVWKAKKYFKVDWNSAVISEQASFPFDVDTSCWNKTSTTLVDDSQEVSEEHISFTLAVSYQIIPDCHTDESYTRNLQTHTVHYKYSFMPDRASDYKPYVYTGENDPLMRKFGYFTTVSPYLNQQGRSANTFYMNRWKPGTHTIYFAPGFPDAYRWVYDDPEQGIIARTNKIFADAGIDVRFEIKSSDDTQKIGDIRYSFVNIVENVDDQAPLGFGPSTAHPRSGEILSANSTLWTSELKYQLDRIKELSKRESERGRSTLLTEMQRLLEQDVKDWTASSAFARQPEQASLYRYLLPEFTYANPGNGFANRQGQTEAFTADKRLAKYRESKLQNAPEISASLAQSAADVEALKKDMESDSRTLQRRSTVWTLTDSMFAGLGTRLLDEDAKKIVDDIVYRVAIHEFGHNLNLRHNFYGSVDAASRGDSSVSTSVMDYLDLKDEIGTARDWEPYDRAALLYAYSDGRIDSVKASGDPYLFCTDEHLRANPLCNQFDKGSTPTEILLNMIEQYDDGYWMRNFRYGRDFWSTAGYGYRMFSTMWTVKKFFSFKTHGFQKGEMLKHLLNRKDFTAQEKEEFHSAIQGDMEQSVRLAIAFYAAVIKQKASDRPFADSFDKSSGALTRIGIGDDKMLAMRFLMGDDAFALDPNLGSLVVSFVPELTREGPLNGLLMKVMSEIYVNPGDMYAGFEDIGREYFIASAAGMVDRAQSPTEFARISCFTKERFADAFNLPVESLDAGGILDVASNPSGDAYFEGESEVLYRQINGNYYAAGANKNPFAAALIDANNVSGILNSYLAFYILTEGRVAECR